MNWWLVVSYLVQALAVWSARCAEEHPAGRRQESLGLAVGDAGTVGVGECDLDRHRLPGLPFRVRHRGEEAEDLVLDQVADRHRGAVAGIVGGRAGERVQLPAELVSTAPQL